jgi:hypothetical protein
MLQTDFDFIGHNGLLGRLQAPGEAAEVLREVSERAKAVYPNFPWEQMARGADAANFCSEQDEYMENEAPGNMLRGYWSPDSRIAVNGRFPVDKIQRRYQDTHGGMNPPSVMDLGEASTAVFRHQLPQSARGAFAFVDSQMQAAPANKGNDFDEGDVANFARLTTSFVRHFPVLLRWGSTNAQQHRKLLESLGSEAQVADLLPIVIDVLVDRYGLDSDSRAKLAAGFGMPTLTFEAVAHDGHAALVANEIHPSAEMRYAAVEASRLSAAK